MSIQRPICVKLFRSQFMPIPSTSQLSLHSGVVEERKTPLAPSPTVLERPRRQEEQDFGEWPEGGRYSFGEVSLGKDIKPIEFTNPPWIANFPIGESGQRTDERAIPLEVGREFDKYPS